MDKEVAARLWERGLFVSRDYVLKDHRPGFEETGHYSEESLPTWGELLAGEKVSWLVARRPDKKGTVCLLERVRAIEMVEAKCERDRLANPLANRPGKRKAESGAEDESANMNAGSGGGADLFGAGGGDESAPATQTGSDAAANQRIVEAEAARQAQDQAREEADRKRRVWRRGVMSVFEDKLRSAPAKAMTAAVWEPLLTWIVDLVIRNGPVEFLEALMGDQWPAEIDPQEIADALMNAFEKDKTERSQMRWAILLLLGSEMGGTDSAQEMKLTDLARDVATALGVLPEIAKCAEDAD
jgi:hypothetical protein